MSCLHHRVPVAAPVRQLATGKFLSIAVVGNAAPHAPAAVAFRRFEGDAHRSAEMACDLLLPLPEAAGQRFDNGGGKSASADLLGLRGDAGPGDATSFRGTRLAGVMVWCFLAVTMADGISMPHGVVPLGLIGAVA